MSVTVKELLKSNSICESYAQMKKGPIFDSQCINIRSSAVADSAGLFVSLNI